MTKFSAFALLCTVYSFVDTQGLYFRRLPWGIQNTQSSEESSLEVEGPYPTPLLVRRPVSRNHKYGPLGSPPPSPFPFRRPLYPNVVRYQDYDSAESGESSESSLEDLSYEDSSYERLSPRYYGDYSLYSNRRNPYLIYDDGPIAIYRSGHKKKKGCKKGRSGKGCEIEGGWWYIWDKKHGYLQGRWGKPPPPGLEKEHYDHGFGHYGHNYGPGYNGWGKIPTLVGPHNKHQIQGGHHGGHGGWGWGGHGGHHGYGGGQGGHHGHGGGHGGWGWGGHGGHHGHGGGHGGHPGGWGDLGWGWAEKVGWGWR